MPPLPRTIAALRRAPAAGAARTAVYEALKAAVGERRGGSAEEEALDDAVVEVLLGLYQQATAGCLAPDDAAVAESALREVRRRADSAERGARRHEATLRAAGAIAKQTRAPAPSNCPFDVAPDLLDRVYAAAAAMRHQHRADLEIAWSVCLLKHQTGIGFSEAAVQQNPALIPLRDTSARTFANRVAQQQKRFRDALREAVSVGGVLRKSDPDKAAVRALIDRLGRCPDRRRIQGYGRAD